MILILIYMIQVAYFNQPVFTCYMIIYILYDNQAITIVYQSSLFHIKKIINNTINVVAIQKIYFSVNFGTTLFYFSLYIKFNKNKS